ncbi:metallophosphoesterase family protein [Thermogladius sp. 4427co]|uniref:metallophosphoesterase family protein n=1 Tax=Thermogladius sp. 4427co TaxID=3450718 RepID=UPI003F79656C
MRILHTSDLHLGSRLFSESKTVKKVFIEALREIADTAVSKSCNLLVISGDFYDSRGIKEIPSEILLESIDILNELKKHGVKVIVSPGNHDFHPEGEGVLNLLEKTGLALVPRVEVSDFIKAVRLEVEGFDFIAIPGLKNASEVELINKRMVRVLGDSRNPEVVMAHTFVDLDSYKLEDVLPRLKGQATTSLGVLRELFPRAVYFALGHVHFPIPLEKKGVARAAYPGAPVGYDGNDLFDSYILGVKGFRRRVLVVDIGEDRAVYESVELKNTPDVGYIELSPDHDYSTAQRILVEAINRLKGPYRVVVAKIDSGVNRGLVERLRALAEREGAYIHFRVRSSLEETPLTLLSIPQQIDLFESERKLLEKLLPKYGITVDPSVIQELISRISEGVSLQDVLKDLLKLLG